ncbi:MAG: hypothetical protein ACOX3T_01000 [Bdellovibrionota bacterium]
MVALREYCLDGLRKEDVPNCESVRGKTRSEIDEVCEVPEVQALSKDCPTICKFWITAYNLALSKKVATPKQLGFKYFELRGEPCIAKYGILIGSSRFRWVRKIVFGG